MFINNNNIGLILKYFFSVLIFLFFTVYKISFSSSQDKIYQSKIKFFKPVITELIKRGADTNFIFSLLADSKTQFNERFVKINVTGYLTKTDYSHNYNRASVKSSNEFLQQYIDLLTKCEEIYKVPKEIIAAIIWIETKNGKFLGNNHIPSVFLSTALAEEQYFIDLNIKTMKENFKGSDDERYQLEQKIIKRAGTKSNWAINELLALEKMSKISPVPVNDLTGSWAGAFGIPQFLPSSYIKWAVDGNGDGIVNLFTFEDAIYSVANYLRENGWGQSRESQRASVFLYNNSTDYVDAVFKLASRLRQLNQVESDSINVIQQ